MKMKKYKLFWRLGDTGKRIHPISFCDDEEYYSFLKRQFDEGYRQIIISSEAMIELIKECVIELGLKLYNIEFAEEDASLSEDVDELLKAIAERPVLFNTLIEQLHFLAEKSSIDIYRVSIDGRLENGEAVDIFIQSNGILAISESCNDELLVRLSSSVERCLFG